MTAISLKSGPSYRRTQGNKVLMRLREMILAGELQSGQRLTETHLSELLGVSRTPIRQALPVLARDRLIEASGAGFIVREVPQSEILECVEIRGLLESAAVKALADDGASRAVVTRLNKIIRIGDSILEKGFVNAEDCQPFHEMNEDFHALIVDAARRPLLIDMIDRLNFSHRSLPFMAFNEAHLVEVYQVWCVGHHQHRSMLGAIEKGDGFRAAAIAREHINTQSEALERFSFHV